MSAGLADEDVRTLAREILSQRDYARWRPDENPLLVLLDRLSQAWEQLVMALREWLPSWLVALGDGVADWLRAGHYWSAANSEGLSPLGWLLGLVLLAVAVAGVLVTISAVRRHLRAAGPASAPPPAPPPHRLLLAEARELAAAGRSLEAAHHAQLATLQLLLERGWLELERSDPNRTLRRRLARAGLPEAERGEFLALLGRLEGRWFRDRTGDPELYHAWCRLHERLDALAAAP